MMENKLKQIIKEEIDRFMNEMDFKKDFEYLDPFKYMGKVSTPGKEERVFVLTYKGNDLIIKLTDKEGQWYFTIEADRDQVDHSAKISWGPYTSYEEMKKEVVPKLVNNLQLSTGNLRNTRKDAENDDLRTRLKELEEKEEDLMSLKTGNLEDLKKLCKISKKLRELGLPEDDFFEKIRDQYNNIRGITNTLNKLPQIDYYKKLEKFQGY